MKMVGIIFSNIYDANMGELTRHRTMASLPFGSRYRQIDFVLSSMVNSNISTVGVITKYNYQSLMDHLGSCSEWDLNRKNGGLYILPPFSTGHLDIYRGKIEALYGALTFLRKVKAPYVVLSDSTVLCNIDFEAVLEQHVQSDVDVTVVCNREAPLFEGEKRDLVLKCDGGKVIDVLADSTFGKNDYGSMGMFVMGRETLVNVVENCVSHGFYHFEKDYIQREFNRDNINIGMYHFKNTVLRNEDVLCYFRNNLRLMEREVREDIFAADSPIYTKVRDEVPAYYGPESKVSGCLIADGCSIYGEVENSVIFRDVTIEPGSRVRNSIVMQGTHIGRGADLNYAILDKEVQVRDGAVLTGAPVSPVIVNKARQI